MGSEEQKKNVELLYISLKMVKQFIYLGTYQVQTNLSVQTMQTSIWATRSTFKGEPRGSGRGDLQKCDYPIQERVVNCKITQSPHAPWMLIRWPRLKFARFARRGWFAPDMFPMIYLYDSFLCLNTYYIVITLHQKHEGIRFCIIGCSSILA